MIVAVADNGVIGQNNSLPWHLPDDLRHFKRLTLGKPVIMGRKTFDSIGKPLPGRSNIVVSRSPDWNVAGVQKVFSPAEAVALAAASEEAMVIGGAGLFAALFSETQKIYLTEVHHPYAGDVYFPPFDRQDWTEVSREEHAREAGQPAFAFVTLLRKV